jgi:hypothetical protein
MSLRELAEADNLLMVEDDIMGFAVGIKLTSPEGTVYLVKGLVNRKGVDIDPETGLLVPGSCTGITVRLSSLGGALPDDGWIVETTDIAGDTVKGKAMAVMLDRTAGRATMVLRK